MSTEILQVNSMIALLHLASVAAALCSLFCQSNYTIMSSVQTSPPLSHGPLKVFKALHLSDKYRAKQRIDKSVYWKGLRSGVHPCLFLILTGQRARRKCTSFIQKSARRWTRLRQQFHLQSVLQ